MSKKVAQKGGKGAKIGRPTPPSFSHLGLSFLALLGCYPVLRDFVNGVGGRFDSDKFVLLVLIGCYGGVGCSGWGLYSYTCAVYGSASYRAFNYRLRTLVGYGLVSRYRLPVSGGGLGYGYRLSPVGLRLFVGCVGRDVLRSTALLVREGLG